jgi:CRP-like cAMP-binding protein
MTGSIPVNQNQVKNKILRKLKKESFDYLATYLTPVTLPVRRSLVEPRKPIAHVCFIETGLASVVAESGSGGRSVEIRHIGYEGIAGYPVVLGVDRTPNSTFMQIGGSGLHISTERFLPVLRDEETRLLMLRYIHTCELQLAHTALAAAKYNMHQRLARWLLMCHDRIAGNNLPLTHEFLALMLGVRRSGVTDELHILEGLHAIKATRGNVLILDRQILIEIAGGCYGVPEAEYDRLMGEDRSPITFEIGSA